MQPFRVGLIGFGLAGRVFHAPLVAAVEGLELAAIVSSRRDEVAKLYPATRVVSSAQEVIEDPSIALVVVATPNDSHFDLAARALKAGKHVVVDKPFACTAAEARELVALSAGRVLTVFHNRRWDSDFLTLKHLIAEDALGEVVYFESHFDRFRPQVRDRWRERAGLASGTWYDLGSHLADQALQLFGMPCAVMADLAARRDGAQTTDYFRVLLRYERLRVVLTGDALAPADDRRLIVHGTKASFLKHGLDPQEAFLAQGGSPRDSGYGRDPLPGMLRRPDGVPVPIDAIDGAYVRFYEGLRETLRGSAPLPVTAGEALAVMDILEAAEQSVRAAREVVLC